MTVTDYDALRRELGVPDLGPDDDPTRRATFWRQAATRAPLLTRGVLANPDDRLRADFGFGRDDVAWEAHVSDADGAPLGWVLAMRPGVDWRGVRRAVTAGAGPLLGAAVRAEDGLVLSGGVGEVSGSWATTPEVTGVLREVPAAAATYIELGCRRGSEAAATSALEPLAAYAVTFEGGLATAWLGPDRTDLFARADLGGDDPLFVAGFEGGVGDPGTGRIGFRLTDPAAAARYTARHGLPAGACAQE
ncbi:hypothetical protein [Nocardioides ferulae]|uniref:hypothetical protein n=1 Tax=Nocardioides ferulae TaxID=2340821 RepID=UPI000F8629E2|nr:hypothetical protein [Nocardioides ferulae]